MFNTAGSGTTGGIATFTERMRITSGGNVGIGTQTPALRAQINASGAGSPATSGTTQTGALRLSNGYSNVVADFGFDISNNVWMQMTNAAALGTNYNLLINPNGGNVGIGAIPSAWGSNTGGPVLEFRNGGHVFGAANSFMQVGANAYYDGSNYVYKASSFASRYLQNDGQHSWFTASSGTAGGTITFSERMRIFNNGRVAINTTTDAGYQLDVNGGTRVTGRLTITGNDTLAQTMSRAGTSAFSAEIYNSGGDNSWLIWGVESSVGGVIFPGSTAYAAVIGQFRNTPLEFFTNNTIRGSFSGAGAFRVHNLAGTGSRIVVADANGVLSTTASAAVTGSGTTNYIPKFTAASTIGNSLLSDDGVELKYTGADGATIQGTTSGFLSLYGTGDNYIQFKDAAGTAGRIQYNHTSDYMSFSTASTERLRITSGGNVGIGTATAVGKLTINSALGDHIQIQRSGQTDRAIVISSSDQLNFGTWASPTQMVLTSNGRLLLNTTTDAGYQLDVNGSVRSSGSFVIGTNGDTSPGAIFSNANFGFWFKSRQASPVVAHYQFGDYSGNPLMVINPSGNVGIGTATPTGTAERSINIFGSSTELHLTNTASGTAGADGFTLLYSALDAYLYNYEAGFISFGTSNAERLRISSAGVITVANLAGSGARLVVADASGNLSATTLSSSVTTGSGTTNYITKWTGASALGNSQIIDNGNIGIGDVPLDKFTITVDQNSTVTGRIRNTSTGSSAYSQWAVNASGNSWGLRMGSSAANSNALDIVSDALGTPAIRMRYFTNGRIGVNTTTDAGYQLDINGTLRSVNGANFATTSGNVGIGVVPSAWSVVTATQIKQGALSADQASNIFNVSNNLFYDGSVNKYIQNGSAAFYQLFQNQHIFYNAPSGTAGGTITFAERMRIDASGNVGIGTASPAYKLTVKAATDYNIGIGLLGGVASINALNDAQSAYTQMRIDATNLLINTYSGSKTLLNTSSDAGDYKLQVSGNIYNTGSAVLAAAGGEVLIGTTTDLGAYKLQVNGISFFGSNANKYALLNNTSSNAAIQAYGDWVNHLRLTYPAVVDFDMQVTAAGELDVKRSSNVVTRINAAGKFLINTTTDVGDYKLQVNGSVYNTGQVTAGVINIQGTGAQLFVDGTTNLSPLSAIQTLSGANNSAFLSGNVTWNTTGSPNAIDISVTNTASGSNANFMQLGDGTNNFKVTKDAGIITANPTSGTARKWKLGSVVSSTVVLVTSQYVEVEINGTFYRLALVTPA
jgi:hypothetical protein